MPTPRIKLTSAVVNGKIYAIGGVNKTGFLRTVEAYDPSTNLWSTKYSMPEARQSMASSAVNGKIYVLGGRTNNTAIATVEEYNPASDN